MLVALEGSAGIPFGGGGRSPEVPAALTAGRAAIRAVFEPLRLPGDAVVMVGTAPEERAWAEAARLAKFLPAGAYMTDTP